ncbi:hypothetical protein RRG08_032153 [Elysia crispata]|uniref:Uncharacterized protein n=1 Tax=Elysia crispata TaxID=231223 RepID=A0AAE1DVX4_9GAST|nr:hypothetical protein RRG08_032153 [Elysia crispata]
MVRRKELTNSQSDRYKVFTYNQLASSGQKLHRITGLSQLMLAVFCKPSIGRQYLRYYRCFISRLAWDKNGGNGQQRKLLSDQLVSNPVVWFRPPQNLDCSSSGLVSLSNLSLRVPNGHLTEAHRLNHSTGPGTAQFNGHLVPFSLSQLHTRLDAMNGESRERIIENFETSWSGKFLKSKNRISFNQEDVLPDIKTLRNGECLPITDLDVWNRSVKLSSSFSESPHHRLRRVEQKRQIVFEFLRVSPSQT